MVQKINKLTGLKLIITQA